MNVIVDRRRGERRQVDQRPESENRLTDRRSLHRDPSQKPIHRLAYRGDGFEVYEQTSPVPARCPACGIDVHFEMPRFAEPRVQFTLTVLHETIPPRHASHLVDFQSFSATGRELMAFRIAARPASEPSGA